MTTEEFIQSIEKTYQDGVALVRRKNKDYANSENPFRNFEFSSLVGVSPERAILVRIADKLARIANLLDKDASVTEEAITDSILDDINYLAILKALLESKRYLKKTDK